MSETTTRQFGLIVAYILPGFIGLAGIVPWFPVIGDWLRPVNQGAALDVAAPVYAIMAAMTFGMILSCFRWLIIDRLHHETGLAIPIWNDRQLGERLNAFDYLVEVHYRYYQFYANTLIAIAWAYGINRFAHPLPLLGAGTDLAVLVLCLVLFAGSRDALAKYYTRTSRLLGSVAEKESPGESMTNGNHHDHGGGTSSPRTRPMATPPAAPEPEVKPKQQTETKTPPQPK